LTGRATRERLVRQRIAGPRPQTAGELVRAMGAVQAQDYAGSLWAMGLRLRGSGVSLLEEAIAAREIVRTWPMRGTLHFVPAADARWMLHLLTPRVIARSAGRYRELGLEAKAFARSRTALVRALKGGRRLMRQDAYAAVARAGVSTAGQRGIHILGHLAQQGLICFGPRQGRQPTFVLLDEWVPRFKDPPREQALATLATRYFASHGPATVQDFAWWTGLLVTEAREAMEAAGAALVPETPEGRTWRSAGSVRPAAARRPLAVLLPPWDEYLVGYKDRAFALEALRGAGRHPLALIGTPLIVIDGQVRGSWRRTITPRAVRVSLDFWTAVGARERRAVDEAVARYGRFLGTEVEVA
jgi:hypothetical protein